MQKIKLYKMCRLGRCWYSASSECTDKTEIIGTETFIVPPDFTVKEINGCSAVCAEDKVKHIHTDITANRPYVLKIKKRKLDGKPYGNERVYLIPEVEEKEK